MPGLAPGIFMSVVPPRHSGARVAGEAGRVRTLSFHRHSGAHESGAAAAMRTRNPGVFCAD